MKIRYYNRELHFKRVIELQIIRGNIPDLIHS